MLPPIYRVLAQLRVSKYDYSFQASASGTLVRLTLRILLIKAALGAELFPFGPTISRARRYPSVSLTPR